MRVFVTGASGFIGSAVVRELVGAGHKVLGLARSDAGAKSVASAGAEVHRGALEDLDSLKRGAAASDGVIHTAFIHERKGGVFDFSNFAALCQTDKLAIEAMGAALAGSNRPLIVSSGVLGIPTENDQPSGALPRKSEETGLSMTSKGVRSMVIRLPPTVHGDGDQGFLPVLVHVAREKGFATYVGDGRNAWPAVHRLDAAHLFCLALEKGTAGARYHAVAEQGIALKEIAEAIGRGLGVQAVSKSPDEAFALLGFIGRFLAMGGKSSSARTQEVLGWHPTHPGLIADIEKGRYFV